MCRLKAHRVPAVGPAVVLCILLIMDNCLNIDFMYLTHHNTETCNKVNNQGGGDKDKSNFNDLLCWSGTPEWGKYNTFNK